MNPMPSPRHFHPAPGGNTNTTDTLTGTWTTETLGGNVTCTFPADTRCFTRLKVVGPKHCYIASS